MPVQFTLPGTRHVLDPDPPGDMNNVVNCISASGYQFNILNTAWAGGAATNGTSDSTAAIQACMNAAAAAGLPVIIPGGTLFRVSQLTWNAGQVMLGVYSGTYPDNGAITTSSVLARLASTNLDMIKVPDGTNYGRICDIALDGNKNNNSAGRGFAVLDGVAGQETQIIIERCYFHDNPDSNLYLGHNRRANKVSFSVFNYSGNGDGITTSGSDNLIRNNIVGSNGRGGIVLGTTITQNWAAASSPFAAAVEHVVDNDIYGNVVGIALAQSTSDCMIFGNGIDRNTKQGITVYDGDSNVIECNSLHSNGTLTNNTYAHIDVASGVTAVGIHGNNFGPLDAGVTNNASFCVNYAGSTGGIIAGNIGIADATASVGGLINSASNTPPYTAVAKSGALIQGSGNNILELRNTSGTTVTKVTGGGTFVHSGGAAQYSNAQNVMGSTTALASAVLSLVGTATGTAQLKTQLIAAQTADIADFFASNGTTLLAAIDVAGRYLGPDPVANQLYGYLAQAYDPAMGSGGTTLGTAGTVTLIKIPWPVTQSVTNIVVRVTAGGTLTAAQCFAGLYDSGGNRLGVTADQSGVWNSSGTSPKTMAISGGPVSVTGGGSAGFIYVALLWNGTVSPSFLKAVNNDSGSVNGSLAAAALRSAVNSSANTSLPSTLTLSGSTAVSNLFWAALS